MEIGKSDNVTIIESLLEGEGTPLARLLNALSYVHEMLGEASWVGFYEYDEGRDGLYLGPYQGHLACLYIQNGKGVVGDSFKERKDIYVPDVSEYPGYICCDERARSEAVFYLENGRRKFILDIDHPDVNGLEKDLDMLKKIADLLANSDYFA